MKSAKEIHGARIKSFLEIPLPELALRLRGTLDKQLHYIEHQDLNAWQEFAVSVVEERIRQGAASWDVIRAGQVMLVILGEFFESQLGGVKAVEGQDASKILARIKGRIQGMDAVATAVATRLGLERAK